MDRVIAVGKITLQLIRFNVDAIINCRGNSARVVAQKAMEFILTYRMLLNLLIHIFSRMADVHFKTFYANVR